MPGSTSAHRRIHLPSLVVLAVALLATLALALSARAVHRDNERRLLDQRAEEVGAILTSALPNLITPLAGAAEVAEATEADARSFHRLVDPLVTEEGPFATATIWTLADTPRRVVTAGADPQLADAPAGEVAEVLQRAREAQGMSVAALFDSPRPVLGYSFTSPRRSPEYVIYAESPLPEDRTSVPQEDSAFDDLDSALYLGEAVDADTLVAASNPDLPLRGLTAATTTAFGDTFLHLVLRPTDDLGGELPAQLPWLIAAVGAALAIGFALMVERLARRRDDAQALAAENGRLYAEQRSVAHSVQQSLLPATLPRVEGLEVEVRYEPGVEGTEVGGDWYDLVDLDGGRLLMVVGDVSGRGLQAATVMALARHATRAYAADGDDPATILRKLSVLVAGEDTTHFATVLCLVLDLPGPRLTIANAGHPRPLLIGPDGEGTFLVAPTGAPVGVESARGYEAVTVTLPPSGTLLAFTDGLFERRGETIDVGMERLRTVATRTPRSLVELVDGLVAELEHGGESDDVAIVGVRW